MSGKVQEEGEGEKGIISMEIKPNRCKESPSICLKNG
jgi:hypothetical protein